LGKQKLVDLSHPFGDKSPLWPYFEDVKIERVHYHAKSGVLSQKVSTVMHCTTHADSPAHVIEGTQFTHEIPLEKYYERVSWWTFRRASGKSSQRRTWKTQRQQFNATTS